MTSSNVLWASRFRSGPAPELMALSLDVACISGAYLIGHSALMLTELSDDAKKFRASLLDGASRVHHEARNVHGLG